MGAATPCFWKLRQSPQFTVTLRSSQIGILLLLSSTFIQNYPFWLSIFFPEIAGIFLLF